MALMLQVLGPHAASMGANARRTVAERELKIGRESGNDWVFPQNYVSRQQAVIRCVNGMYFLEPVGSCPIRLNAGGPLDRNRIVRLSSGDRLLIDDIEILVTEADVFPEQDRAGAPPPRAGGPAHQDLSAVNLSTASAGSLDPLDLLGIGAPGVSPSPDRAPRMPDLGSILDEALPRASVGDERATAGHAVLSDDWFASGPSAGARPVTPPDSRRTSALPGMRATEPATLPAAESTPSAAGLEDLLRGAGLDPAHASLSPEVVRQLGEVLRIVVEGTMQVLKARNEIRREFRLPMTQVAPKDNNPLKFSADAADALHKLLVQRSPAYLDTVSAFADAFDDIRLHQLAMLEALRTAFDDMLRQFDPQRLEEQLAKAGGRGSVLGLGARSKPWDFYVERFRELAADRDFAFRRLFGEEFGKAYEQALQRAKQSGRSDPGRSGGGA